MMSIAVTFIISVMALYVYCNQILYPGLDITALPLYYTGCLMLHITGTLTIIYHSSSLTKEVNSYSSFLISLQFKLSVFFSFAQLQGKRTFRIGYDIINCCQDPKMMQTVWVIQKIQELSRMSFIFKFSIFK